jgi:hypothetical protein
MGLFQSRIKKKIILDLNDSKYIFYIDNKEILLILDKLLKFKIGEKNILLAIKLYDLSVCSHKFTDFDINLTDIDKGIILDKVVKFVKCIR